MKLSTQQDIDAPIEKVFAAVSDFEKFEKTLLKRGAKVERLDELPNPAPGMAWDINFAFRGRQREAKATIEELAVPDTVKATAISSGIHGYLDVELRSLSQGKTRMKIGVDMRPKTLPARVLVQSLKLAQGTLKSRFKDRVANFAKDIENR